MPVEITSIPALLTAFSGLIGCGAVAWWLRSGIDLRLAQRDAAEARKESRESLTKSSVLESRVNQQDTIINEIRTRMAKLDRVDELVAVAKYIEEAIKQMMPRSEQEAKWEAMEQRMARLESDVRHVQDHTINLT